ncbi:MAG: translation initiation factor eIF-2B subunit delta [Archaeoglobi archaeon]|nr:translation initiation factor eIF-2B subunit delta [Archaeoglobi archaeon]MDK2781561.1 translation initiation factor eIF-2B subunit delta [Archaeoglobi archaeon]
MKLRELEELIRDNIHGASHITERALRLLERVSEEERREFSARLERAHPLMPSLHLALSLLEKMSAEEILELFERAHEETVRKTSEIIERSDVIITISNSRAVRDSLLRSEPRRVFVTESRPVREGELLVKELRKNGIDAVLITDASIGIVAEKCTKAVVGGDALTPEYLINKIGTYPLALVCREKGIPFYASVSSFKHTEKKIKIGDILKDVRDPSEISSEVPSLNIYFDATPRELVKVISDASVAQQAERVLGKHEVAGSNPARGLK